MAQIFGTAAAYTEVATWEDHRVPEAGHANDTVGAVLFVQLRAE